MKLDIRELFRSSPISFWVTWEFHSSVGHSNGDIYLNPDELLSAFDNSAFSHKIIIPGKFIRVGQHLAIPNKGLGGDPYSPRALVLVDEKVNQAIRSLHREVFMDNLLTQSTPKQP